MPYPTNESLPQNIKDALPVEAQAIFRKVANSQLEAGETEEVAFASAWAALKKQGWEKEDGDWVRKSYTFEISKRNDDKKQVFGWASVIEKNGVPVSDYQEDTITEDELEKAFYKYMLTSRKAGEMHVSKEAGQLIEMMVFTKEKQKALGIDLGMVGAWVGYQLSDDVFQKVKSGEYKMFSIGGSGKRKKS